MNDRFGRWNAAVESLQLNNGVVQGWARLEGEGEKPSAAYLDIRVRDGGELERIVSTLHSETPCQIRKHRISVSIFGRVRRRVPQNATYHLVLEWSDHRVFEFPIQSPRIINSQKTVHRIIDLPWRHYLSRAMRLIRTGQVGGLSKKGWAIVRASVSAGMKPQAFFKGLSSSDRPICLIIDHDLGGGANLYRAELIDQLNLKGYRTALLTTHYGLFSYQLSAVIGGRRRATYPRSVEEIFLALPENCFKTIYLNNILSFPAPLEFLEALSEWLTRLEIKPGLVVLVHDYYSVCPSWFLLDTDLKFCGIPKLSRCDNCLPNNTAPFIQLVAGTNIRAWRATWFALLVQADETRCFSNSSRDLLKRAHALLDPARITVVPHDVKDDLLTPIELQDPGYPVVAVIGHISLHKGREVVENLASSIKARGDPMRIIVVGTIDSNLPKDIVTVTGAYRKHELRKILERHHVNMGFLPSICPETFSYATQEMINMELPLLVFDHGAPAERVSNYFRGSVIAGPDADNVLEALYQLYRQHVGTDPLEASR